MENKLKRLTLGVASVGLLTLYGCGGGGGATTGGALTTGGGAAQVDVPITVIDGLVEKAKVCLDKNNNGACDVGEPAGSTGADGKVTLKVDAADVGKYPVISFVEAGVAIDAENGPVTVSFTMRAPADQTTVITPLTTMVQDIIESAGVSSTVAETQIKQQTGINISLFEDFTKGTTADHTAALMLARMVVVTTQQQINGIKAAVDANNAAVPKADLDRAVQKRLLEMLPSLVAALQDVSFTGATDKQAALLTAANALIAREGITLTAAADVVAINKATTASEGADVPGAGFSLSNLSVTDTNNWYFRIMTASLAQDTPDAAGNQKYVTRRFRSNGDATTNAVANWGTGSNPWRQADLHWNGSAWANCPINFENTSAVRDAKGNSSYNYCDGLETGSSSRATLDVADMPMIDIYKKIREAGYNNLNIGAADNVAATSLLGAAKFPAGSKLSYQTTTTFGNAVTYYPGLGNVVIQPPVGVGAGGTATASPQPLCATDTGVNDAPAANLEELIAKNTGTPCISGTNANTGTRNESWGGTTLGMGKIGTVPTQNVANNTLTSANYYTGNLRLRVAFGANTVAKYYKCQERLNASTRNCDLVGTGTYAIQTLGDGRTMTFSGLPALFSAQDFTQVFVERGGRVYSGFQNRAGVFKSARLNTQTATALLTQINPSFSAAAGTPVDPSTLLALTAASYQGVWFIHSPGDANGPGIDLTINANGSASCQWMGPNPLQGSVCFATVSQSGVASISESVQGALSNPYSTASVTLNFLDGTGSGTYVDSTNPTPTGPVAVTRR
ncbi:MAG: hypothetical protein Q8O85_00955 [Rhodoferax sp.]|uniref:hypothetical protein n=1 Tax=Rhodoferax sp. TaxID=50421 RepID=UPI002736765C|nr:hypothetical protein [Rhodoferax sp.]MDP2677276.1 hypothetical protein [Rhodoferax sp.]